MRSGRSIRSACFVSQLLLCLFSLSSLRANPTYYMGFPCWKSVINLDTSILKQRKVFDTDTSVRSISWHMAMWQKWSSIWKGYNPPVVRCVRSLYAIWHLAGIWRCRHCRDVQERDYRFRRISMVFLAVFRSGSKELNLLWRYGISIFL